MADTNEFGASVSPHVALRAEIATRLAASGKDVREIVITDLTKTEIDRRAAAVKVIITKIDNNSKELKKMVEKDGVYAYNAQSEKVGEPTYTKEQAEALKKNREETAKLQAALTKAFDEGDFGKVLELGKS